MSTIVKRAIAVFAALMLAGMTVGCEREPMDTEGVVGEEGAVGEDPGQLAEAPILEDEDLEDRAETVAEAREEVREGATQESEALAETREDVAETLEIPTSAVVFAPELRQAIIDSPDAFEREALGTVGTVENYLGEMDTASFNEEQRTAFNELQSEVPELKQDLEQFASAEGQQREQMKSDIQTRLDRIHENWQLVAMVIDFEQPATGGGPFDQQQPLDQQQPSEQPTMDQPTMDQPTMDQPTDQNIGDQMDNPMDNQMDNPMDDPIGGQPEPGETPTY
jgi:hypothetical protein